jgi:FAD:protein FMN transferase
VRFSSPCRRAFLTSLLTLAGTAGARAAAAKRPDGRIAYEDSRVSMACTYAIRVYGSNVRELPAIVRAALDEVDRIDRLMSHYKPESPLSRLNREAGQHPVKVEDELFDFLEECLRYSRDSNGAFDVTVGPLMKAWGFFEGEGGVPGEADLAAAREAVGYRHVILDAQQRTIRFDRPGVELDLGGIAKGYAVDRAVGMLRAHGIGAALVSAGASTLYGLGRPPGEEGWEVKVRDPIHPGRIAFTTRLRDRALSVSGRHEKSFEVDGVVYSHIMDPRTGRPAPGVLGVAVLTGSGTAGDALDDAFYVQGVEESRRYLERLPPTEACFFLPAAPTRWRKVCVRN